MIRQIAVATCICVMPVASHASVGSELEALGEEVYDRWADSDGMAYGGEGTTWENSTRTGYTGPSMKWSKPPNPSNNLIEFSPPRADAGCGGVDFHMGSFSLLEGSELREQLSAMAGPQILTHALGVALDIMSPTISAEMKRLQATINDWNEWAQNDCALAESLVSESEVRKSGLGQAMEEMGRNAGEALGEAPDRVASAASELTGFGLSEDEKEEQRLNMNIVWDALKEANAENWDVFPGFSDEEGMELLMSLVGTVVMMYDDGTGKARDPLPTFGYGSTLTIRDIFYGTSDGIEYLECEDHDRCLEPGKTLDSRELPGLVGTFRQAIFYGDNGGIYEAFRDYDADDLTAEQRSVAHMARGQMGQTIRTAARNGVLPTDGLIDYWAYRIAYDTLYYEMRDLLHDVEEAMANHDKASRLIEDILEPARAGIESDFKSLRKEMEQLTKDAKFTNEVIQAYKGRQSTTLLSEVRAAGR